MRRALAFFLSLCLLGAAVPRAEAAYSREAAEAAMRRLMGLMVLRGKGFDPGDSLPDPITRAELVTVLVRTFGREQDAERMRGKPVFADTADHWASGNIAVAVQMAADAGASIGMPDGTFHPNDRVTAAQLIAFTMKLLGVKPMPLRQWPADYLDVAAQERMIDREDLAWVGALPERPITRGEAFYLMDWLFYHYDIGAGKTVYTKHVDPMPPTLMLNPVSPEPGSGKLTITGRVEGAVEVYVDNRPATVFPTGEFTYDYDSGGQSEYAISVIARDLAGNTVEESITMARCAAVSCQDYAIVAADGTYLGELSSSSTSDLSVCNASGIFGNAATQASIWTPGSPYGSPTSDLSAFNPNAATPPAVRVGMQPKWYITVNSTLPNALSPQGLCEYLPKIGL